ncbi:hypothetical protein EMIHUDRAFT_103236 [Emiliania huxleyi CCMP1516]|uniref:Potassium transporter n=2 Tax=Emiliania huxleyi TaxID=2903 RepID=A0A0D3IWU8_EMIH1|nr:hypothetical protein EMIHUDRAFT_103236 [Emiliania huxleyi CCMP1516]EOD15733.1 hypothetical protein EMIHUDRAFT_103236 [Emiliania huxleyi CCMP1516]|eukprot:XP_005768162.1 hypothetical protein EMIHUDRAFT_103236 [Emiliania huxleyi CCMP1516]
MPIPSITEAVRQALASPSACVPDGAATISVTNKHHAKLRSQQFARLRDQPCFMSRVVSVCYNNVTDGAGVCVRSSFALPPSDFRRSNYANLIWAKWRILADALAAARVVLWLDADVLILRNPWDALRSSTEVGARLYAIRYQAEEQPCMATSYEGARLACTRLNGGQLLVSSRSLASDVYALRPANLSNMDALDQDYADTVVQNRSYSRCALGPAFAAACWRKRIPASAREACGFVTYHTNCITNMRDKLHAMKRVLEEALIGRVTDTHSKRQRHASGWRELRLRARARSCLARAERKDLRAAADGDDERRCASLTRRAASTALVVARLAHGERARVLHRDHAARCQIKRPRCPPARRRAAVVASVVVLALVVAPLARRTAAARQPHAPSVEPLVVRRREDSTTMADTDFSKARVENSDWRGASFKGACNFSDTAIRQRISLAELKAGGLVQGLKTTGYSLEEIKAAGYSPEGFKAAGYSLEEMKAVAYSLKEMKAAGYSCSEVKAAGYSLEEIKAAGYSCSDAKAAGYSCREAKAAAYSLKEMKAAGFSCSARRGGNIPPMSEPPSLRTSLVADAELPSVPSESSLPDGSRAMRRSSWKVAVDVPPEAPPATRPPEQKKWQAAATGQHGAAPSWRQFLSLCLGATGVVFGDIGTSEGGSLALMQVVLRAVGTRAAEPRLVGFTAALGMIGTSLLIGDGAITPVMSVLGAIEGLPIESDAVLAWLCVAILVVLFGVQSFGSKAIGLVYGPIMSLWFLVICALGVYNTCRYSAEAAIVARGFNPYWLWHYWFSGTCRGYEAWKSLAGIVLTVTGAEALYADMGHFGRRPIMTAWFALVFPSLVLQYIGQAAALLRRPELLADSAGTFYGSAPASLRYPLLALAILAAVIASQALLSGVFSVLSQAVQAGFMPRTKVVHTDDKNKGQVFIQSANLLLLALCIVLALAFKTSAALAGAYGIAVTTTFVATTVLLYLVLRRAWKWCAGSALLVCLPLLVVDGLLWSSNLLKIANSGWVPIVIALAVFGVLSTYNWGREEEAALLLAECDAEEGAASSDITSSLRIPALEAAVRACGYPRTRAVGIYLTPYDWRVPRSLGTLADACGSLPGTIVLLNVRFEDVPFVPAEERVDLAVISDELGLYQASVRFGYAEPLNAAQGLHATLVAAKQPKLSALLAAHARLPTRASAQVAAPSVHYILNRLHHIVRPEHGPLCRLRVSLYKWLKQNECPAVAFFGLEDNRTLEVPQAAAFAADDGADAGRRDRLRVGDRGGGGGGIVDAVHGWASRSVDEAIETLASPDVTVTNQSDKELQLYKLRELDELVQEAVARSLHRKIL